MVSTAQMARLHCLLRYKAAFSLTETITQAMHCVSLVS